MEMGGGSSIDWHRLAIILEWLSFFLVTPEFVGGGRLKQVSAYLERFGQNPFKVADVLTSGRRRPLQIDFAVPGMTRVDVLRTVWRQIPQVFLVLLGPAPIAVFLAWLPWPFLRWLGLVFLGLAAVGQLINWVNPDWLVRVGRWPRTVVAAILLAFFPTLSFQAWVYLPLAFVGYAALKLSDLGTFRALLFGLGVAAFTAGKLIDFLT